MQHFAISTPVQLAREKISGATAIAVGLALLLVAAGMPMMPAITAMARVALGATDITIGRFQGTPTMLPVALLHAATYCGLYALFVGTVVHSSSTPPVRGLGIASAADLAASSVPMAAALQRVAKCLQL